MEMASSNWASTFSFEEAKSGILAACLLQHVRFL